MRKVEPADIDAGVDQLFDDVVAPAGRADRGDDFRLTHRLTAYNATGEDVQSRTMNTFVRGGAKRVLAIGAPGEGSLSPEDALAPDGMLIVMESDPARAELARRRFASAGLDARATVIAGDPRRMLYKLAGPFDLIFCDDADSPLRDRLAALLAPSGMLITNDNDSRGV
ncbi:MAG: hypothetical protein EXQ55_10875 [Acidobacteria bacterium]|nr:hypothetical protein [Acidobacteriota bacterium]